MENNTRNPIPFLDTIPSIEDICQIFKSDGTLIDVHGFEIIVSGDGKSGIKTKIKDKFGIDDKSMNLAFDILELKGDQICVRQKRI